MIAKKDSDKCRHRRNVQRSFGELRADKRQNKFQNLKQQQPFASRVDQAAASHQKLVERRANLQPAPANHNPGPNCPAATAARTGSRRRHPATANPTAAATAAATGS